VDKEVAEKTKEEKRKGGGGEEAKASGCNIECG
jgi:hypothetical protein